jgi:hypothetical protein
MEQFQPLLGASGILKLLMVQRCPGCLLMIPSEPTPKGPPPLQLTLMNRLDLQGCIPTSPRCLSIYHLLGLISQADQPALITLLFIPPSSRRTCKLSINFPTQVEMIIPGTNPPFTGTLSRTFHPMFL